MRSDSANVLRRVIISWNFFLESQFKRRANEEFNVRNERRRETQISPIYMCVYVCIDRYIGACVNLLTSGGKQSEAFEKKWLHTSIREFCSYIATCNHTPRKISFYCWEKQLFSFIFLLITVSFKKEYFLVLWHTYHNRLITYSSQISGKFIIERGIYFLRKNITTLYREKMSIRLHIVK